MHDCTCEHRTPARPTVRLIHSQLATSGTATARLCPAEGLPRRGGGLLQAERLFGTVLLIHV